MSKLAFYTQTNHENPIIIFVKPKNMSIKPAEPKMIWSAKKQMQSPNAIRAWLTEVLVYNVNLSKSSSVGFHGRKLKILLYAGIVKQQNATTTYPSLNTAYRWIIAQLRQSSRRPIKLSTIDSSLSGPHKGELPWQGANYKVGIETPSSLTPISSLSGQSWGHGDGTSAVPCSQLRPLSELVGVRLQGRGVSIVWSYRIVHLPVAIVCLIEVISITWSEVTIRHDILNTRWGNTHIPVWL